MTHAAADVAAIWSAIREAQARWLLQSAQLDEVTWALLLRLAEDEALHWVMHGGEQIFGQHDLYQLVLEALRAWAAEYGPGAHIVDQNLRTIRRIWVTWRRSLEEAVGE